jgi:hypothetical protein
VDCSLHSQHDAGVGAERDALTNAPNGNALSKPYAAAASRRDVQTVSHSESDVQILNGHGSVEMVEVDLRLRAVRRNQLTHVHDVLLAALLGVEHTVMTAASFEDRLPSIAIGK